MPTTIIKPRMSGITIAELKNMASVPKLVTMKANKPPLHGNTAFLNSYLPPMVPGKICNAVDAGMVVG